MSVVVLGGGIGGLSTAYYLLNRFATPTTLYEASNRLGGWIRTEQLKNRRTSTEFRFETGPHTLRPKGVPGANTLQLIEEIKLPIHGIPSTHVAAKNRMIYANGKLCLLPNSLMGIFRKLPPFSKPLVSALFHDLFAKRSRSKFNDESIYDFAKRRFGNDVATYAISSMVCGICAGNAKEISVRFLMNDLYDVEQKYGGVAKGLFVSRFFGNKNKSKQSEIPSTLYAEAKKQKWAMYCPVDGMEALPNTLANYLKEHNVNIQLGAECKEINFDKNGVIMNIGDKEVRSKHVISSLPSFKLAPCVRDKHPTLADKLLEIPYVDVAVVSLQFSCELKQNAFGFLVPPVERLPILGIIFDSCCIDMKDNTVLTVMMGGHWFEEYFGRNPTQKQLLDTALDHVHKILNIEETPDKSRVHILSKCIPQYTVGHKERVATIRKYINSYKLPISVCGAAYDGVGLNDAILSARQQVEALSYNI